MRTVHGARGTGHGASDVQAKKGSREAQAKKGSGEITTVSRADTMSKNLKERA